MKLPNRHFLNFVFLVAVCGASNRPKPIEIPQRPVLFLHGLSSACSDEGFQNLVTHLNAICLETGPHYRSLQPYHQMALTGCRALTELVREDPDRFARGIYVGAYSNGGIVTRNLLLHCPLFRKLVRRMIIHGTPHLGTFVNRIPFKEQLKSIWKIKRFAVKYFYSKALGKHTKYLDNVDNLDYKENHRYIKALAAEETQRRSFDLPQLELWMNLASDKDMVVPWESSLFGASYSLQNNTLVPFTATEAYQNKYLGLHKLYDEGRYMNCMVEGIHAEYDRGDQEEAIFNLFKDNCSFDPEIFGSVRPSNLYRFCLQMKMTHSNNLRKVTCDPTPSQMYHKHGLKKEIRGYTMTVWKPNAI